jgi:hypothetical protein
MSTFKQYLTESVKSYDYKIKIAGAPKDIDANRLETALAKFEVAKMSAGKSTPIQSLPLDFPALSNESVTIFDVTTNYPASVREMKEYIADYIPKEKENIQSKEDAPAESPISTGKPAVKGNPDPASHYKFRQPKPMKDIKPSPSISQKGK